MKTMRGFSLVELMVAMTLSLVLMAGALSILYSSRLTYAENDRMARLQEAGRTTVEMIVRDIRASGFAGCQRYQEDRFDNRLNNNLTTLWNFAQPLLGHEATGGAWIPALDPVVVPADATTGSDVLVLRTSRLGQPIFRTNAATIDPTAPISVDRAAGATVPAGTTMVISDCEYASVFAVTGVGAGGSATTAFLQHGASNPGNVDTSITANFPIDSLVTPVDTVAYYVRKSNYQSDPTKPEGPALWQKVGSALPQPLIEGIQNLQIRYGIDTDNDLIVNEYRNADLIGNAASTNWEKIISISIAVLVRSENETGVEKDGRTYNLLGTVLGPFNDRRQRTIFTTTVALRNGTN
jgi:type IV pilus assembly protein PilW